MDRLQSFPGTEPRSELDRSLLQAVRDLIAADQEMRRTLSRRMLLSQSDVRAIRFVIAAERAGQPASPHQIATHLGMTTAATTTLLDRLVTAGHVRREPHPTDRRSKVVLPTPHAMDEVQHQLGPIHDRMRAVARAVPAESRADILSFLGELTETMRAGFDGVDEAGAADAAAGGRGVDGVDGVDGPDEQR